MAQVPEETVVQKHSCNTPASLTPALDNMKVVTELMAGLGHNVLRLLYFYLLYLSFYYINVRLNVALLVMLGELYMLLHWIGE
jgi:hypothetical protein